MRVLHIWRNDFLGGGGGAIAMYRLHLGLRDAGVDSRILCKKKSTASPYVSVFNHYPRIEKGLRKITSRMGLNDIHCISAYKVKTRSEFLKADIVHIHGMHSNFLSYLALPEMTRLKPIVFTLHDMWALTGHCAVNYDCERWKNGCGKCPYPDANPPINRDATHLDWKLKKWVYNRSQMSIVSPSACYAERAAQSSLQRFPIHHIPHGIDCSTYKPHDPDVCRSLLGIPREKKVLMLAAIGLNEHGKGGDLLLEALERFPESLKKNTMLLLLGNNGDAIEHTLNIQTINLGYVVSDHLKAIAYCAADLFVHPSRVEAFGLVCLESIACGTPVVAFEVGGVPEIIRHKQNGYLAEAEDSEGLYRGINTLLNDKSLYDSIRKQCRAIAEQEFDLTRQVQAHIQLYSQLVSTQPDQLILSEKPNDSGAVAQ